MEEAAEAAPTEKSAAAAEMAEKAAGGGPNAAAGAQSHLAEALSREREGWAALRAAAGDENAEAADGASTAAATDETPASTPRLSPPLSPRASLRAGSASFAQGYSFTQGPGPPADPKQTLDALDGVRTAKFLRRSVVSASQVARAEARNDELRELFRLPKQGSQLLEEYSCALQKKILLQGKMYVFEEFVCFYANIFGYVKTKVLPLSEVTSVRRCKHVGFPNSIEFYYQGRREFFTSFLSRDDAYWLVVSAWSACSNYSRMFFGTNFTEALTSAHKHHRHSNPEIPVGNGLSSAPLPLFQDGSLKMPPSNTADAANAIAAPATESDRSSDVSTSTAAAPLNRGMSLPVPRARAMSDVGGMRRTRPHSDDASMQSVDADGDDESGDMIRGRADSVSPPMLAQSPDSNGALREDGAVSPDEDADDGAPVPADSAVPRAHLPFAGAPRESGSPLPVPAEAHRIAHGSFPVSPERFFRCIFSDSPDDSNFFVRYHQRRGDMSVQCTPWRASHPIGIVRDLSFQSAISKWSIGSRAGCHQTQRYRVYEGADGVTILFETSQTMANIPYGDYFTVETRWDVTSVHGGTSCRVEVNCSVPFSKATMLRSQITRGTLEEARAGHELMLKIAHETIGREVAHSPESLPKPLRVVAVRAASDMAATGDRMPLTPRTETARVINNAPPEWRDTVAAMLRPPDALGEGASGADGSSSEAAGGPSTALAAAPAPLVDGRLADSPRDKLLGVLERAAWHVRSNPVVAMLMVLNLLLVAYVALLTHRSSVASVPLSPQATLSLMREEVAVVHRLASHLEASLSRVEAIVAADHLGSCASPAAP